MVQIVGTYKHTGNAPNYESYFKALGADAGTISNISNVRPTLKVSDNNGEWTFHNSYEGKDWSSTFKLGEPFNETFNGKDLKRVAKREGDKIIIESLMDNSKDTRVYEFTDSGITVHISNPKISETTTATYQRV